MHKIVTRLGAMAGVSTIAFVLMGASSCDTTGGNPAGSGSGNNSGVVTVAQGQPMNSDGKVVTITGVQRGFATGNQFETPNPGQECLKVNVSLANNSGNEWLLPLSDLSVVDNKGQKYTFTLNCGTGSTIDSLVAHGKATGTVVYEVPVGSPIDLTFQDAFGTTYQSSPLH
jgi:Domain of unknown function (DUF4352)